MFNEVRNSNAHAVNILRICSK